MKKNTLSILMPVRNTAPFLGECLDSIIAQSHTDWELLAVDDHSEDASRVILQSYADRDGRIRVLRNEGRGIIPALRLAYQKSKGAYITRMDSDDRMMPRKLELLHRALKAVGRGRLAVGGVSYFSQGELGGGYARYADWLNGLTAREKNFDEIYKECVIPSPCWMLHREDLDGCGAFQPNDYPEDYDLCFRFYQRGLKVVAVAQPLHQWRDYPERSSRNDPNYLDNRFTALKIRYFKEIDYQKDQELYLWGAGKKGKQVARELQQHGLPFHWVCENPRKTGKEIYGQRMGQPDGMAGKNVQVLVAVTNPAEAAGIRGFLEKMERGQFWFLG